MEGEGAAQTIDRYLEELAYSRNSFRLKSMYRDTRDDVLTDMNNALLSAYNAWQHNRDAARALGHLESVQATCLERLTAVFRSKYNTCVILLRVELSREQTPEPEHQDAHCFGLVRLPPFA
jgi:hypothetical protein